MNSWHVATAAEAISAAQFARFGLDVSMQYGANQPEYDLIVARGEAMLKVSVKGSQDGSWGLTQSQLSRIGGARYHDAADLWLARHKPRTALCLVQFKGVAEDALPRVYLAWPAEIAERLKAASGGRGDTILHEDYQRGPKAAGAGTRETLPDAWRLTRLRVDELLSWPVTSS
ncbi:hypothetical protein D3273_22895 [Lichenibacterium minor]|uniref:Uncharacterized protein n=1 Tax=Lichenibacterium minor TaxID=2316528 RepID=A0A4Q2U064_9HYPH|nr:hypothetical protein [Lichenibacterium minor]RYC29662.1 hypothetical protein D3273_22895 [Lichenibacterium minor]